MPQPTKKTVKGKEVWDWEEQEEFLYKVAIDFAEEPASKESMPF